MSKRHFLSTIAVLMLFAAGCGPMAGFWSGVLETSKPAVEEKAREKAAELGLTPEATEELVASMLKALEETIEAERARHPETTPWVRDLGMIVGTALLTALGGGGINMRNRRVFHTANATNRTPPPTG